MSFWETGNTLIHTQVKNVDDFDDKTDQNRQYSYQRTYVDDDHDKYVNKVIADFEKQSWYQCFTTDMKCNLKHAVTAIDIISHVYPMYRIFDENTNQTYWFKINYSYYLLNFVPYISNHLFSKYIWKLKLEERIIVLEYLILLSRDMIIPENYQCNNCINCKGCVRCIQCKDCYLCSNCIDCESCKYCDKCEQSKLMDSSDHCFNSKQCVRSTYCNTCEQCYDCRDIKDCKHSVKLSECVDIVNAFNLKKMKNIDAKKSFRMKISYNIIRKCGACNKKICRGYVMLCCKRCVCFDCYTEAMKRRVFFCPNCKHGYFVN